MRYPARFEPAPEGGFVITFRDIPEAITQGDTKQEAEEMAADALLTCMDFYFEDQRPVPFPSKLQPGEELVTLPASIWAKVLLLNQMLNKRVKQAELARLIGIKPQEVTRMVDLHHATKIDQLQKAIHALGGELQISIAV